MIRFWFKYVMPFRHMIEIESGQRAIPFVKKTWDDYMGEIYEDIAFQLVLEMIKQGKLPFVEKLGRWWNKDMEFDIVGLNQKKVAILGEVKWGHFSSDDLRRFRQKIKNIPFDLDKNISYVLFSGKGFQAAPIDGFTFITGDSI